MGKFYKAGESGMSSLYNLTSSYQSMFNSMTESGFDTETIEDTLASYRDDLELKIENCIKYSENQLAVASAKKDLAKKLNDEAEKLEKESSNLIEYVDHNMRKLAQRGRLFPNDIDLNSIMLAITDAVYLLVSYWVRVFL